MDLPGITVQQVDLGDVTVGLTQVEPGWRWSDDVRPQVGGEWRARTLGSCCPDASGRRSRRDDVEFGPNDVFEIPPGHDGFVVGDEPCVQIEWAGLRAFAGSTCSARTTRSLATLLFTDIVTPRPSSRESATARGVTYFRPTSRLRGVRLSNIWSRGQHDGDGLLATFRRSGGGAALRGGYSSPGST